MAATTMLERVFDLSYYYLGVPRPRTPDFRLYWNGEAHLRRVLQGGRPVVVALLVPGEAGSHYLEDVLKRASAEYYQRILFMQVNCAEAGDFCRSRNPTKLPSVEVFVPMRDTDGAFRNRLRVFKYNNHLSLYGFRTFLEDLDLVKRPTKSS